MDDTTTLILVHLVEPKRVGERFVSTRASWPLHVTLVPWFTIAKAQEADLRAKLVAYADRNPSFQAVVGVEEVFARHSGTKPGTVVNLFKDQTALKAIHLELLQLVETLKGKPAVRPQFVRERYRAHITHHDVGGVLHRRQEGEVVSITDITLLRRTVVDDRRGCVVLQTLKLGGGTQ